MATRQESLPIAALDQRVSGAAPKRDRRGRSGWLLTAPFFILYFLFPLWPVIGAAWKSLFSNSLAGGSSDFRGLGNYGELLEDGDFWAAMWHTLWFTVLSTVPLILIPLAILGALPLLIAFLFFQRQIVQGISNTGLKG